MADSVQHPQENMIGGAQLLVVEGLPPCTIQAMADGTWHVTAQLVRDEEAALAVTALPPDVLCQRAQHALGLGCFLGQPEGTDTTVTIPPQGLTKTDLMGELGDLLALPTYQLALPFTHEAWRQLEYARTLAGTTA